MAYKAQSGPAERINWAFVLDFSVTTMRIDHVDLFSVLCGLVCSGFRRLSSWDRKKESTRNNVERSHFRKEKRYN